MSIASQQRCASPRGRHCALSAVGLSALALVLAITTPILADPFSGTFWNKTTHDPHADLRKKTPQKPAEKATDTQEKAVKSESTKGEAEKKVRLTYLNAGWERVLKDLAEGTGGTLVMHDIPEGRFSRKDTTAYNRTDAVRILNSELEPLGFRIMEKDQFLTVIAMRRANNRFRPAVIPPPVQSRPAPAPQVAHANGPIGITPNNSNPNRLEAPRPNLGDTRPVRDTALQLASHTAKPTARKIRQASMQDQDADGDNPPPPPLPKKREATEPAGETIEKAYEPTNRSAIELGQQIYRAFSTRTRIVAKGPHGFPAFDVYTEALKKDDLKPKGAVSFSIEADGDANRLFIRGVAERVAGVEALISKLDTARKPGETAKVIPSDPATTGAAKSLDEQLKSLRRNKRRNPNAEMAEGEDTDAEKPADRDLQTLISSLKGEVNIEAIDDLDLLILRGNEKDVEAVLQVIRTIESLAGGSSPTVHLLYLQNIDSEALGTLLNDVYTKLAGVKRRGDRNATVQVIPVVQPNAILIVAPGQMMEAILELADELDQPGDPQAEVTVFRLKVAVASQIVKLLDDFYKDRTGLGTKVKAVADLRTNSIIVQGRPNELREVAALIKKIDRDDAQSASQLRMIPLEHAPADEVASFLNAALQGVLRPPGTATVAGAFTSSAGGAGPQELRDPKATVLEFLSQDATRNKLMRSGLLTDIRIQADTRTNRLMVTAPKNSLPLLEELIRELDQPTNAAAEIKVFTLKNADAQASVELLQSLFSRSSSSTPGSTGGSSSGLVLAGAENSTDSLIPLKFSVDGRTNSVLAVGGGDSLRIVEAILLRLDESDLRNRKNAVVKLRNSYAPDVANAVTLFLQQQRDLAQIDPDRITSTQLLEQEVIVTAEAASNNLLISATPRYFEEIRQMVDQLDREPAQVIIQALLVEVTLDSTDEFGVELGFQSPVLFDRSVIKTADLTLRTLTSTTGVPPTTTTTQEIVSQASTPGFGFNNQQLGQNSAAHPSQVGGQGLSNFSLGRVNNDLGYGGLVLAASSDSISALLRALAVRRNVHVLSRPQILALDNQLAQIQVGQQVPIVNGVTINAQGLANPNITQDNAGIILTVVPRISPEGRIVMELVAEKSQFDLNGVPVFTQTNGSVIRSPIKNLSTARTTVKVPDGQTIVVGGMITQSDDVIERKVPWLGDLPIIKYAFRYDTQIHKRTELLIFLTPRIIHSDCVMENIKQVEIDRLHFFHEEAEAMHGPLLSIPGENGCPEDGNCPDPSQYDGNSTWDENHPQGDSPLPTARPLPVNPPPTEYSPQMRSSSNEKRTKSASHSKTTRDDPPDGPVFR